ncbi:MAG TPA: MATE family efflux transporter [Opitutaceae bacterium]|nr:MATE family efflux transporter [Opitutaceae bacterium]
MSESVPVRPRLLSLAWPIFVEQALRMLIGTVDIFMVSHVSDGAVAALNVGNQVVIFFLLVFNFIGVGASVVVTHCLGARDPAGAGRIARSAVSLNLWLGVAASLFVFTFAGPLLRLLQLPAELEGYALPFLTLMGGTLMLESVSIALAGVLRAHTHTRDTMLVLAGQNLLNLAGNAVLLFGLFGFPAMGVTGVALASVAARVAGLIALWILVRRRIGFRFDGADLFRLPRDHMRRILRIGLPSVGENICWWTAFMTITAFTSRLGAEPLATQSYVMQILWLVIICTVSLGLGNEIVTGHLVGGGAFEEAYHELRRNVRLGITVAMALICAIAVFAPQILAVFSDNPSVIAGGAFLLRLSVLLEPGRVMNVLVVFAMRATGDARYPLKLGVLVMWGVWVPLAWLLGLKLGWGLPGIWAAMIVDEWTRGLLNLRRWNSRRWLVHAERSRREALAGRSAPSPTS